MYLTQYDVFAIIIALLGLMFLVFTTFRANARITRDRDFWRGEAIHLDSERKTTIHQDQDMKRHRDFWRDEAIRLDSEVSRLNGIIDSLAPNDLHAVFTKQD